MRCATLLLAAVSLVACARPEAARNERQLGATGAVLGAVVGSQLGNGKGRLATTAAGAVVGHTVGATVGESWDDRVAVKEAESWANAREGRVSTPGSAPPDGGSLGGRRTQDLSTRGQGQRCANRPTTIVVDGKPRDAVVLMCEGPDGRWYRPR
jgi:surface antigen